jgi:hypothetical protein
MKPTRYTITHARSQSGQDVFSVSPNKRAAAFAAKVATDRGYAVLTQTARFDFTLAQWGLALDAVLQPCPPAARALAGAAKAPRAKTFTPKRGGAAFATPKPTFAGAKLVVLAGLEDAFALKLAEAKTLSDDQRRAFDRYNKMKALALGPISNAAMQNEATTALRLATIELVKLVF